MIWLLWLVHGLQGSLQHVQHFYQHRECKLLLSQRRLRCCYDEAISADTEEGQWEAYKECDAILAKDLPVSVILHSMNTYLFNDTNYEGLVYSCGNYVFTYLKAL